MRLPSVLARILSHPALVVALVACVLAMPLAGVVACPVEETDAGDSGEPREVELAAAAPAVRSVPESATRARHDRRPDRSATRSPSARSPHLSPADAATGVRLRC